MRSILSMFGQSPFRPLVSHIEKVRSCVDQVLPMFDALNKGEYSTVTEISELIVRMEHDADIIKDKIRTSLPQSLFLPVDKKDFLKLLSAQDDIADAVEDLAVLIENKGFGAAGKDSKAVRRSGASCGPNRSHGLRPDL